MKLSICLFILFLFGFQQTESCSCELRHPQNVFCDADYAVKVLVKSVRMVNVDKEGNVEELKMKTDEDGYADPDPGKELKTEMKVKILEVFKGEVNKYTTTTIYTVGGFNSCERVLDPLRTYLLMGSIHEDGLLHVLMCDYVLDVSNEPARTIRQITRNFGLRFPLGCTGKCHVCRYPHCYQDKDTKSVCQWPNYADMYDTLEASKYSCVPNKKKICKLRYPRKIIDHGGLPAGVIIDDGGLPADDNGVVIDFGGLPADGNPVIIDHGGLPADGNSVIIDDGGLGVGLDGNPVIIDDGGLPANGNSVIIDDGGLGVGLGVGLDGNPVIIDHGGLPADGNSVIIDDGGLPADDNGVIIDFGGLPADDNSVIIDDGGLGVGLGVGLGGPLLDYGGL